MGPQDAQPKHSRPIIELKLLRKWHLHMAKTYPSLPWSQSQIRQRERDLEAAMDVPLAARAASRKIVRQPGASSSLVKKVPKQTTAVTISGAAKALPSMSGSVLGKRPATSLSSAGSGLKRISKGPRPDSSRSEAESGRGRDALLEDTSPLVASESKGQIATAVSEGQLASEGPNARKVLSPPATSIGVNKDLPASTEVNLEAAATAGAVMSSPVKASALVASKQLSNQDVRKSAIAIKSPICSAPPDQVGDLALDSHHFV